MDTLIQRADSLMVASKIGDNTSRKFLDSAYHTFQPGPLDLSKKYKHFAWSYVRNGDERHGLRYADSASIVLEPYEKKYKHGYAQALLFKGQLFEILNREREAFDSYYLARNYAIKNLDSCQLISFTYPLSTTKYSLSHPKVSAYYSLLTINESKSCKDGADFNDRLQFPIMAFNNLGLYYKEIGKLDSALFYVNSGFDLLRNLKSSFPDKKIQITRIELHIHNALGKIYLDLKEYKKAEFHFKESIKIIEGPISVPYAVSAYTGLATVYFQTYRFKEAAEIIRIMERRKIVFYYPKYYFDFKHSYFNKIGQSDSAYIYLNKLKNFSDSVDREERLVKEANMEQAFETAEKQHQLQLIGDANKRKQNYLIFAAILFVVLLVIVVIVTKARRRLARLNLLMTQTISALQDSQKENALMMKVVAHDLRSPAAATVNIAGILLQKDGLQPDDRKMIEVLEKSGSASIEMIDDLLMLNASKEKIVKTTINLDGLLQHSISILSHKAEDKKIKIRLQSEAKIVYGSTEKLWRVFNNILINAIKFSREHTTIDIRSEKKDDHVLITFKDHGIGIPKDMQHNIFNINPDKNRTGTFGEKSFGLGLFIAKQIVEAHDGQIWVESDGIEGTTFFIELPLKNRINCTLSN
ncbi:ATP-binding protein [Pedobacter sp.]|uniref:tetratricopeptide repeat-containing sensor histidine kinase n=1 Tax=Pedobacter sp. TaxID=1411316 RepID=UPI00396C924C